MASLFGKHRLKSLASTINTEDIRDYVELVKTWHNDYHNGTLKVDKETSREQAYNRDFFLTILGYKEKPANPFSFEPKATTEKGQLPDAVLSHTEGEISNIAAVVELKGAGVDLDRPQRREGNMSPVQQGFKYKTQYRSCPFVVVSNFWEFRLYRDNLLDYEVWTLDDLVNPDNDYFLFKTWFGLLKADHLTTSAGSSKTENLLTDIRIEQEEIGKKFYKIYREARLELLRDIYKNNPEVKTNIDLGIEKAQKIIDRIVFTCFAEDTGLLPDNTLQRVIKAAESSAFGGSLWNTLKGFFDAIDTGSDKLEIPDGYNGGLFKHDPVLNNLKISDKALQSILSLSTYSFREDLSVTILGHIFEQSISDLEEIKNKVNESQNLETISQSRRKKDGIFYTPDYIVRYIVDNSLGAYLREHEQKCKDEFKLKGDIQDKTYEERERKAYEKYQTVLQNVKVLDPACGSGAFLVYVFDYLMAENKRVASILGNGLFSNDDYIRSILKNNIFGVDLNEESVEITKLSLWLKSAEKGKKLTSLDKNIKCGNSLISDPAVAGSKAFDWQKEFSEVMSLGGFDVVVGNPPYVRLQNIRSGSEDDIKYYETNYQTARGRFDLYVLFIEKAMQVLSQNGKASYILPHKFLGSKFGEATRKYLSDGRYLERVLHFGSHKVFADASTYTCILLLSKDNELIEYIDVDPNYLQSSLEFIPIQYDHLSTDNWVFASTDNVSLINKVTSHKTKLNDAFEKVSRGVVTGADSIFILSGVIEGHYFKGYSKELGSDVVMESSIVKPLLMGSSVSRYEISKEDLFLLYPHKLNDKFKTVPIPEEELEREYPKAYAYLMQFKNVLVAKKVKYKTNPDYWYSLHNSREISVFEGRKIISPYLALHPNMAIDEAGYYTNDKCTNLVFKNVSIENQSAYFAILNSKLVDFYIAKTGSEFSGGYFAYTNVYLEPLSFPELLDQDVKKLADLVNKAQVASVSLESSSEVFKTLALSEYKIKSWPTKLNFWWRCDLSEFISLSRIKVDLAQKDALYAVFSKYQKECVVYETELSTTENEINQIVYRIYGLTSSEIASIEE